MPTDLSGASPPLLLAPGGDEACVKAALLAGADAVYLGLPRFSARMRATNISEPALPDIVRIAHQRGARIYLTMNTLLANAELPEALATAERASLLGVDAVIVQDWGLLAGLALLARDGRFAAELHASTQMTTLNAWQLEVLAGFGVSQVILARELDLKEVTALTARAADLGMRTEVFVHGAYCISVSGQCTMSSAVAGRSGNRGECAQPCRRRYRDAAAMAGFPLSLKDCSLYASLGRLVRAGVSGLKIEGRMKGAEYVYTVVRAYRRELDRVLRGEPSPGWDPSLDRVFNRRFHDGYLRGELTSDMFGGEPFDASLEPVGTVRGFTADTMLLRLDASPELAQGDLLSVLSGDRAILVCKTRILRAVTRDTYEVGIEGELKGRIARGCPAFRHPSLPEAAGALARARTLQVVPEELRAGVEGRLGRPLRVTFTARGRTVTVESESPLASASRHALDEESLRRSLGRLGGTPFDLRVMDTTSLDAGLFVPVSQLNELRRRAVELLSADTRSHRSARSGRMPETPALELPRFGVVLSDPAQASAFADRGVAVFLEVTTSRGVFDPSICIPVFPAVLFDGQLAGSAEVAFRPGVRAVVSSNVGLGLQCARRGVPWIAGPHANVTNAAASAALRDGAGASAFFHSPELSVSQIREWPADPSLPSLLLVAGPQLVMTIRQCIVRNVGGCPRPSADASCVIGCRRSAVMHDEGGRPFFVEKRPGGHTEIYNGSLLWYPQAVRLLAAQVRCFVLDLRDLPFASLTLPQKLDLLEACERGGRQDGEEGMGARLYGRVTRGGFGKGF